MKTVLLILIFVSIKISVYGQYPPNTIYRIIPPPVGAVAPGYLSIYDDYTTSTRMKQITKEGGITHAYAKRQTWNIDETKYKILSVAIYDANTHAVYKQLDGSGGIYIYDSFWSNIDPNLVYGFIEDGKIKVYHVDTEVLETLYDLNKFSVVYESVKLGPGEGNIDNYDKYVALIGHVKNSTDMKIIVFDLQAHQVVVTKTFEGMWRDADWQGQYIDWVSVSQSGKYVGIMWNHNYTSENNPFVDQNGASHYGVEMYNTTNLNYLRRIVKYGNHGDFGFAPNGSEVFVQFWGYIQGQPGSVFSYHLDGSGVDIILTNEIFTTNGSHLSCRNILRPGWAYLNTHTLGNGHGRMIAVKLDGSETIENYGHSFATSDTYNRAAFPVPNPTGTKIMFKSNFGDNSSDSKICCYEAYSILNGPSKSLSFFNSKNNNGYVITNDINNLVSGNEWTMEAWVKFDNFNASSGESHIMRLGGQLFVDGNRKLRIKVGDGYGVGSTTLSKNRWYHLAYVRTVTEVILYLDGKEEIVASGSDAGSADKFILGTFDEASFNTHCFSGKIDEVRLWNDARSQAEIKANKDKELKGIEDDLLIYYDFNYSVGATVVDRAGCDNDGTLFNMDGTNWSIETPFRKPIDEVPLPKGTELLSNNYFDYGLSDWGLNGENSATLSIDYASVLEGKNSTLVHVNNTFSDSRKIQLLQVNTGDGIKEGRIYHIQFMAKSNKTVSNISAVIQQLYGSFSNVYSKNFSLEADKKVTIVDTFLCKETDGLVKWSFNLGKASVKDVDIWFDAVHLIELDKEVSVKEKNRIPVKFELSQNYPNPFNPTTEINFSLSKEGMTKLSVYNILGQEVKVLLNENMYAGTYSVSFDGSNLTSGIYFYKLQSNNQVQVKKMLLLK